MGKTAFALLLALALPVSSEAEWVALDKGAMEGTPYALRLESRSSDGFELVFDLPGFQVHARDGFDAMEIKDAAYLGEIGRPALPSIRKLIQIPAHSDFTAEVIDESWEDFEGFFPFPQQPLVSDKDLPPPFTIDGETYAADAWYPERKVELARPAIWGGVRVATLALNPIRFNPVRGLLRVARHMRVRVRFVGENDKNALASDAPWVSPGRQLLFQSTLINFHGSKAPPAVLDEHPNFLIIVDDIFLENQGLEDYFAERRDAGFTVKVAAMGEVGAQNALALKAYIRGIYEESSPPALEYLLFVGDVGEDHIPLIEGPMGKLGDAAYTFLAGNDFLSDIALGRLPAKTDEDLDMMLGKIALWRSEGFEEALSGAMLIAHRQGYPGKYTGVSEEIRLWNYRASPPWFETHYGGEDATNAGMASGINEGRLIVNYRGHGNTSSWMHWSSEIEYFRREDVALLDNQGRPAVVFAIACDNSDLTLTAPCFAEAWMNHPGGSVAFLGSLWASYTIPNHEFNKYLFRAIYDDGINRLGNILNKANADLFAYFQGDSQYETYMKKNIEMYLWLGDPTLRLPLSELRPPYDLRWSALDQATILLEWEDQSGDEDGFVVESSQELFDGWEISGELPADATRYEYSGLSEAEGRYFRVKTVRWDEESHPSNTVFAQTLPAAPSFVAARVLSTVSARVEWSDNSSGETGYRVLRRQDSAEEFEEAARTPADAGSWLDRGLQEGSWYEYAVEAQSAGGSTRAELNARILTLPAAPKELAAQSGADLSITLRWRDASGGEDGFVIYRKPREEWLSWEEVGYAPANAESYTDTTPGTAENLSYRIAAFNETGVGPMSDILETMAVPAAPVGLVAQAMSENAVSLSWAPTGEGGTAFVLMRSADKESWRELARVTAGILSFVDAGLKEGERVFYRVHAENDAGLSRGSAPAEARALPARPSSFGAREVAAGVVLRWRDNSGVESGYLVERKVDAGPFESLATLPPGQEVFRDGASLPGICVYRVASFHDSGISEYSTTSIVVIGEGGGSGEEGSQVDEDLFTDREDAGGGCGW